jgi:HAD superfamily hydrolase (TIGR01509 family)
MTTASGRALLVDYAGVLTFGVADSWRAFEEGHGIPARTISSMLWAAYGEGQQQNPIALLERGELGVAAFEVELAGQLATAGYDVPSDGLVRALFRDLRPAGGVWQLVRDVRAAGVPCVLLSNSWGMGGYPMAELEATFDHLVFSGEVGMRKPDREMFEHAAGLVDVELGGCVFIDDGPANVAAATAHGLTAVLHGGDDQATRAAVLAGLGEPTAG